MEDVTSVLIAGSFGFHLQAKSLINITLLPKEFEGKIEFVGNTFLLHSKIFTNNKASIQLHEKAGFQRIGYYPNNLNKNGEWRDVYVYERRI